MNKTIIAIVIIAIVVLGGYFLFKGSYQSPTTPSTSNQQPITQPPATQAPTTQATPSTPQDVVTYTDTGFSPSTLRVKVGTTVTFKNGESEPMWVASNPHPIHTGYSGFDAKRGYAKGESYSFTFTKPGTWKYHNHLSPGEGGTIVVE